MSTTSPTAQPYVESLAALDPAPNGGAPSWLATRRQDAQHRFRALGFPTTRDEAWRYTSLASLVEAAPTPVLESKGPALAPARLDAMAALALEGADCLVFVDGHLAAEHTRLTAQAGVHLLSFAEAAEKLPKLLEAHLTHVADGDGDALVALNTALLGDGALLYVEKDVALERPVHLAFVASGRTDAFVQPRLLVALEHGAKAELVESYVAVEAAPYATNAVAELVLHEGATLEHLRVQDEARGAHHLAHLAVRLEAGAHYRATSLHHGAKVGRSESHVTLAGEGATCALASLTLTGDAQHAAQRTVVEHESAGATSEQLHKGVLDGHTTSVFDGLVRVHKDAQKSVARQTSRNLLLAPTATANAKPQLEIYADDVKCNHGATVGRLDEEALFYLLSRGIPEREAKEMLIGAFARDVLATVESEALRRHADGLLGTWLGAVHDASEPTA